MVKLYYGGLMLLVLVKAGSAGLRPSRTAGAVALYTFDAKDCRSSTIPDVSGNSGQYWGNLKVSKTSVRCLENRGVYANQTLPNTYRVQGTKSLTSFNQMLDKRDGFTIDMWIKRDPNIKYDGFEFSTSPILTMGTDSTPTTGTSAGYPCQLRNENLGLYADSSVNKYTMYSMVQAWTRTADTVCYGAEGQYFEAPNNWNGGLAHVVWTFNFITAAQNTFEMYNYVNGIRIAAPVLKVMPGSFDYTDPANPVFKTAFSRDWDNSFIVDLYSAYASRITGATKTPWAGEIHLIGLYDRVLSDDEVQNNYIARLPNIPPTVANGTLTIKEEAEIGDHHSTPEWYFTTSPLSDVQSFLLPKPYDVESNTTLPVYYEPDNVPPHLALLSLPPIGTMYVGGIQVDNRSMPIHITSDTSLQWRPPMNYISTVLPDRTLSSISFRYAAVDGVSGIFSADATFYISVSSVDDPPLSKTLNVTVLDSGPPTQICISGTDDEDGLVSNARVIRTPDTGVLYNGTSLLAPQLKSMDRMALCMLYKYTGDGLYANDSSTPMDTFTWQATDRTGNLGNNATVYITILSSLFAGNSQPPVVFGNTVYNSLVQPTPTPYPNALWQTTQDISTNVTLYGRDMNALPRSLIAVISAVPPQGKLIDPTSGNVLQVGDAVVGTIEWPYTSGLSVIYKPNTQYFSTPNTDWDGNLIDGGKMDTFSYYVALADNTKYRGLAVTDAVRVSNVNDATGIQCPAGAVSVAAVGEIDQNFDGGLGVDPVFLDQVNITGFVISDPDKSVDVVKAVVTVSYGVVSLNHQYLDKVDFNSVAYCQGQDTWECVGSGDSDTNMVFIGTPAAISAVLNNLTYQALASNITDAITVTLYDGADSSGRCINESKYKTKSVRSDCLVTSCVVTIAVQPHPVSLGGKAGLFGLPPLPQQAYIGGAVGVLFFLVVVFACVRGCFSRKRHAKESAELKELKFNMQNGESPHSPGTPATNYNLTPIPTIYPPEKQVFSPFSSSHKGAVVGADGAGMGEDYRRYFHEPVSPPALYRQSSRRQPQPLVDTESPYTHTTQNTYTHNDAGQGSAHNNGPSVPPRPYRPPSIAKFYTGNRSKSPPRGGVRSNIDSDDSDAEIFSGVSPLQHMYASARSPSPQTPKPLFREATVDIGLQRHERGSTVGVSRREENVYDNRDEYAERPHRSRY